MWPMFQSSSIGVSSHKNEYKAGIRIGNWVEELAGREAADAPPEAKDTLKARASQLTSPDRTALQTAPALVQWRSPWRLRPSLQPSPVAALRLPTPRKAQPAPPAVPPTQAFMKAQEQAQIANSSTVGKAARSDPKQAVDGTMLFSHGGTLKLAPARSPPVAARPLQPRRS